LLVVVFGITEVRVAEPSAAIERPPSATCPRSRHPINAMQRPLVSMVMADLSLLKGMATRFN
jgi:hypothetical protein